MAAMKGQPVKAILGEVKMCLITRAHEDRKIFDGQLVVISGSGFSMTDFTGHTQCDIRILQDDGYDILIDQDVCYFEPWNEW